MASEMCRVIIAAIGWSALGDNLAAHDPGEVTAESRYEFEIFRRSAEFDEDMAECLLWFALKTGRDKLGLLQGLPLFGWDGRLHPSLYIWSCLFSARLNFVALYAMKYHSFMIWSDWIRDKIVLHGLLLQHSLAISPASSVAPPKLSDSN